MIHQDTEIRFLNKEKGYGVVATKLIPRGTITWVQDPLDREFSQEAEEGMNPAVKKLLHTYAFTNKHGHKVLCWDNGKYVNHSFNPSCFSTAYDFEIAIRDIHPGEELTDDYGYLNLESPFYPIDEGFSRKIVFPDDILRYHEEWDQIIINNAPAVLEVEQPLLELIPAKTWRKFTNAVHNGFGMRSILECHYQKSATAKNKTASK
jgi:uncharacterized protein